MRLLSRFEVDEILSADYVRCVETVRPLSESIGVAARRTRCSSEGLPGPRGGSRGADPQASAGPEAPRSRAARRGVIDELVERLATADGVDVGEPLNLKKGGVWALSFDDHELVGAREAATAAERRE